MNKLIISVRRSMAKQSKRKAIAIQKYISQNSLQLIFIVILLFFATRYNFNFSISDSISDAGIDGDSKKVLNMDMSSVFSVLSSSIRRTGNDGKAIQVRKDNLSNSYSNVTYWSGKSNSSAERKSKQVRYVERFHKIAQTEMQKFGIPASIILAQGILESNAGQSNLAEQNNNHFGIKCFARNCKKGHCRNYTDDSHKDFFRAYGTPWESYRAHSLMIVNKQYRKLLHFGTKDYKNWAYGLKNMGYATDRHYAESLIKTIEELELHKFDQ
ncbi:MAG: glycoside hydrolase family 73 protein [Saprospiraceae bacterium]